MRRNMGEGCKKEIVRVLLFLNIVRVIQLKRVRRAGRVAHM